MDAGTLRAWTRFASKGGIGSATAMVDCPAAGADDLMFMAGEDIVVLRPLPGATTKGEPAGPFLGFCEGVVGRFDASQVEFHGRLKKPVVVRKQSQVASPHPAPEPLMANAPPSDIRSPDEFRGQGYFSPPPTHTEPLRFNHAPAPAPVPAAPQPEGHSRRYGDEPTPTEMDEGSALPWARSDLPDRHSPVRASALSGVSGMSSNYSRSRHTSRDSAFRYLEHHVDDTTVHSDDEYPDLYAQQPRTQQSATRGRRGSQHAPPPASHLARQASDASSATSGTASSSGAPEDDSASSPDGGYPYTPGAAHASNSHPPQSSRSGKKERDYTSIYDVYGRDSVAFPALAPWNHVTNVEPPQSPPVPNMYLLRGDDPGDRTPRGAPGNSPLGQPPYDDGIGSSAPSRNPSTTQSHSTAATSSLSMTPHYGMAPLPETTVAGLAMRQKSRTGMSPTKNPAPAPNMSPMGPRTRPGAPHTPRLDTSPHTMTSRSPDLMSPNGYSPGQMISPTSSGARPPGLVPPTFSPNAPRSAPPSVGPPSTGRLSPLPSPGASTGSRHMGSASSQATTPMAQTRLQPTRAMGPVDEFGFFLPPGSASPGRIQEDPSVVGAWHQILASNDVTSVRKSRKVKHMCRAGIPPSLRPRVWLFLANAQFRRQAGLFEHLCHQASTSKVAKQRAEAWAAIDADSTGLFADHVLFSAGPGQGGAADLAAVVKAYLLFNPAAGYSRGLGLVAGWLLIARVPPEDAFWLLAALLRHPTLAGYYDAPTKAKQLYTDSSILARLLQGRSTRATAQALDALGLDTFLFAPTWLDALYVRVLPWNTLARVWDAFIFEGPEWLLRVGVALTSIMTPALKGREAGLAALRRPAGMVGLVDDHLVRAAEAVKLKESEMRKLARNASKQVRKEMQHGGLDLTRAQSH